MQKVLNYLNGVCLQRILPLLPQRSTRWSTRDACASELQALPNAEPGLGVRLPPVISSRQALTPQEVSARMAVTTTLTHSSQYHNSLIPRHGSLTLVGYGIQIFVDRGHLLLQDGIGSDRQPLSRKTNEAC